MSRTIKSMLIGGLVGAAFPLFALYYQGAVNWTFTLLFPFIILMMDIDINFTPHFYLRMYAIACVLNVVTFALAGLAVNKLLPRKVATRVGIAVLTLVLSFCFCKLAFARFIEEPGRVPKMLPQGPPGIDIHRPPRIEVPPPIYIDDITPAYVDNYIEQGLDRQLEVGVFFNPTSIMGIIDA
ncbi:unnamed protein product, partial [marine sediment metagenome]